MEEKLHLMEHIIMQIRTTNLNFDYELHGLDLHLIVLDGIGAERQMPNLLDIYDTDEEQESIEP